MLCSDNDPLPSPWCILGLPRESDFTAQFDLLPRLPSQFPSDFSDAIRRRFHRDFCLGEVTLKSDFFSAEESFLRLRMSSKAAVRDSDEDIRDCKFVRDPLPASVLCCSCVLLLVRPVQIPCGERMCEACYKAIRKKDEEPECPKCGAKLREVKVWRDVFADKEISELEVYCNRKEEGCSWQGKQALLKRHMKDECQYRSFIHKDEKKQLSMVKCSVCSEEIPEDKLSQHLELSCPDKDISCEVPGCTKQLQRKALSAHSKDSLIEHVAYITKTLNEVTLTLSSLQVQTGDEKSTAAIESIRVRINDVEEHCGDMEANQKIVQAKILEACYQSVDNLQKETRHVTDNLTRHFTMLTEKMLKFEEIVATQSQEISELKRSKDPAHDRVIASHDIRLAEHGVRLDIIDAKYTGGVLLWKITDVRRRRREAASGKVPSIYSQPFYTSPCGYKMCARLYFHGDGMGLGTHLSLFFTVMRGEFDSLLPWPFRQKVTLVLIDQGSQRNHVSDAFRPDPASSSFQRPRKEMNTASGCPLFVSLATLDGGTFIKDDCMFVKVLVDLSGIGGPDER